jgi:uncharacterized membrane protein
MTVGYDTGRQVVPVGPGAAALDPTRPTAAPVARSSRRLPAGTVAVSAAMVAVNLLVLTGQFAFARAAVGLPVAVIVPGALVLTVLGGRRHRGWSWLLHSVALSLVVLTGVGLVLAVLPGATLSTGSSLAGLDVAVAALALATFLRQPGTAGVRAPARARFGGAVRTAARAVPELLDALGRHLPGVGGVAAVVGVGAGVNALALAVFGARQLNAGGGPLPAVAALGLGLLAFVAAVVAARWNRTTAAMTIVYLLAASVLLATSLRGSGVTGHDIKIEYRVFVHTLDTGSWLPGGPWPGYNSCLSLTVLPSFLARLLGLSALDVFRVCFQLIFALVPVGALLIARRLLPPAPAVLSAGLFIAFPTFVNDMPMLNRQEIALLFFVVGLLAMLDTRGPRWRRATLIVLVAAGLTVSHYSSAAVAAALLSLAWALRAVRLAVARAHARRHGTAVEPAGSALAGQGAAAATMIAMVVGWAVLTGSAATFADDLTNTARAIGANAAVDSDAARYSPVAAGQAVDDASALGAYTATLAKGRGAEDAQAVGSVVTVLPADELPPTGLGAALAAAGVPAETFNTVVRRVCVLLFEAGAAIGCVLIWWRLRRRGAVHRPAAPAMAEWGAAGLVLLGVSLAAPQLTDSYGLLRLYQQLLPILGVAVIVALVAVLRAVLGRRRGPRPLVDVAATLVVVASMVTTTGLLPRMTGGFAPQLNLAAAGPYYRGYLAGPDDVATAQWIRTRLPADAWVAADSRDTANLRAMTQLTPDEGIAPGAVPAEAYLLVTIADAGIPNGEDAAVATAVVGDRIIRYTFPLSAVAAGRTAVHASVTHILYAPYGR